MVDLYYSHNFLTGCVDRQSGANIQSCCREENDVVCGLVVNIELYLDEGVLDEVLLLENRARGGSISVAA